MNILVKVIERVRSIDDVLNGVVKRFKAHLLYINDKKLRNADLSGAYLSGANLFGADLSGADLSKAKIKGAYLIWADLSNANLSGADLRNAKIKNANLSNANLMNANLRGANLVFVTLSGADLSGADLSGAKLNGADLSYADLSGAKIDGASLRNAILHGAKNVPDGLPMACPENGSFIAWKKVKKRVKGINHYCLIKLEIPEDAKRSSATSEKCRCNKAKVLEIIEWETGEKIDEVVNTNYTPCTYKVGEMVYPDDFDDNRWNECSHGIHFFINREDAVNYYI